MEVIGILSLIFGILGLLSSVWYIGILPCVVGIVLGIVGLTDFLSDKKFATAGLLISILGAVVSVYIFVSDVDSGRLVVLHNSGKSQSVDVVSEISDTSRQTDSGRNADLNAENRRNETSQTTEESKETEVSQQEEKAVETSKDTSASEKVEEKKANTIQNDSTITKGQQNALRSAQSYLSIMAFSYEGLIRQLEFEKYSHEDAVYAADNCGADWKEQAAKSAASYLEFQAFSRDGLIEQLLFEGYTNEEAVYGVSANGY